MQCVHQKRDCAHLSQWINRRTIVFSGTPELCVVLGQCAKHFWPVSVFTMSTSYYRTQQTDRAGYGSRDASTSASYSTRTRKKASTLLREDDLSASSLTENYLHRRDNASKYIQRAGSSDLRSLGRKKVDPEDERPKRKPIVQGGVNKDIYTQRAFDRERNRARFSEAEKKAKEVCTHFMKPFCSWCTWTDTVV